MVVGRSGSVVGGCCCCWRCCWTGFHRGFAVVDCSSSTCFLCLNNPLEAVEEGADAVVTAPTVDVVSTLGAQTDAESPTAGLVLNSAASGKSAVLRSSFFCTKVGDIELSRSILLASRQVSAMSSLRSRSARFLAATESAVVELELVADGVEVGVLVTGIEFEFEFELVEVTLIDSIERLRFSAAFIIR